MDGTSFVSGPDFATIDNSSVKSAKVVCLYFSAHWCPPCRQFTPVLGKFYNEVNSSEKKLEIIFVSFDQDEASWKDYYKTMPFISMPFDKAAIKAVSDKYGVKGIPALIILNSDGSVLEQNGRGDVTSKGPSVINDWIAKAK